MPDQWRRKEQNMTAIVKVRELAKRYMPENVLAIAGISLDIHKVKNIPAENSAVCVVLRAREKCV